MIGTLDSYIPERDGDLPLLFLPFCYRISVRLQGVAAFAGTAEMGWWVQPVDAAGQ